MKRAFLQNLSLKQYKEVLKLLPDMHKEKNKAIIMIIFTLFALAFLGIFAINPTISTIFTLQKQVQENQQIFEQLTTKMNALSSLQQQYTNITNDLPVVYDAIPKEAKVPFLAAQIQNIAAQMNVTIQSLRVSEIPLTSGSPDDKTAMSFTVTLEVRGTYDNIMAFATFLTDFSRIVTIDSIAITKDKQEKELVLHVKSREYFKR